MVSQIKSFTLLWLRKSRSGNTAWMEILHFGQQIINYNTQSQLTYNNIAHQDRSICRQRSCRNPPRVSPLGFPSGVSERRRRRSSVWTARSAALASPVAHLGISARPRTSGCGCAGDWDRLLSGSLVYEHRLICVVKNIYIHVNVIIIIIHQLYSWL